MKIEHRSNGWRRLAATSLLLGPTGCGTSPDITLHSIELTQAIQTSSNSVQLVAQRSTAVRVRVATDSGGSASGVDGRLRVFVGGGEITPPGGISSINGPFTAPAAASWDRDSEDHTLNFELTAPTGIPTSSNVDFLVSLDPLSGEPDTGNNDGSVDNVVFADRITPQLWFTRINYTPAGAGLPALADVQPSVGDAFVQGIYPVDDSDPDLYRAGLFPTLTWNQDGNGNGQVDDNGEHSDILDWLESCRQLIVDADGGSGDDIFLYGWIAGNPIVGNGWGRTGGRVAFGNTQHSRHQRTYAHELGHNFGLSHNSRTLAPDTGWDTGARLDGNPGTNNTTGRVKETDLNDIMRGGQLTNSAWVDQTTYEYFLDHDVLDPGGDEGDRYRRGIIAVSGVLSLDGREMVRLNPAFRYPWLSQPSRDDPNGEFIVRVEDAQGDIYATTFSGVLGDDADKELQDTYGFFGVRLAVPAGRQVRRVTVLRRDDQRVLGELKQSEPPRLTLRPPVGGTDLGKIVQLEFQVQDPDTPLAQVRVQFAYSPNGETLWVPIAVNVPGTETKVEFDGTQIQNTERDGAGVIRAIASDGLNTVFQDVGRITVRLGLKVR